MRAFVCLATLAITACSAAPGGEKGRNSTYDGPCLQFFKSKSAMAGDIIVRDSWEQKGMIIVEFARPAAAVNPAAKGVLPGSAAAAKQAAPQTPAVGHCLVNPQDGTMRLPSAFDRSWNKDAA